MSTICCFQLVINSIHTLYIFSCHDRWCKSNRLFPIITGLAKCQLPIARYPLQLILPIKGILIDRIVDTENQIVFTQARLPSRTISVDMSDNQLFSTLLALNPKSEICRPRKLSIEYRFTRIRFRAFKAGECSDQV